VNRRANLLHELLLQCRAAVESWRHLQSDNIEFTMKRLREPKPQEE
jgi:hypothetical protein